MTLACTVVVSVVCFIGNVKEHYEDVGMGGKHTIRARGYIATIWNSDNIYTPDWRSMNEACSDGLCYRYLKHCSIEDKKNRCVYFFGRPGDIEAENVEIVASSTREISRAAKEIYVRRNEEPKSVGLPLSSFEKETELLSPTPCPRHEPSKCIP